MSYTVLCRPLQDVGTKGAITMYTLLCRTRLTVLCFDRFDATTYRESKVYMYSWRIISFYCLPYFPKSLFGVSFASRTAWDNVVGIPSERDVLLRSDGLKMSVRP